MRKKNKKIYFKPLLGLLICGLFLLFFWTFLFPQKPEKGPQPIFLGKHICSHCGMHIDDLRFAAQAQIQENKKNKILFFDDTGCLVEYLDQRKIKETQAVYFQHLKKEQWISKEKAEFISIDSLSSPMGYNFGVLEKGENTQAIDFTQMKEKILHREPSHQNEKQRF